jgi:hypothetical protein
MEALYLVKPSMSKSWVWTHFRRYHESSKAHIASKAKKRARLNGVIAAALIFLHENLDALKKLLTTCPVIGINVPTAIIKTHRVLLVLWVLITGEANRYTYLI